MSNEVHNTQQLDQMTRAITEHLHDDINHPKRYTRGKVECIDALESAVVGKTPKEAVLVAPIIKYLWRYEDKGGVEDLYKARWYLNRLTKLLEDRNKNL